MRVRARVNRIIDTGVMIISYVPVVLYVYACVLKGTNSNNTYNRSCHD
jgi:hypothetical protein